MPEIIDDGVTGRIVDTDEGSSGGAAAGAGNGPSRGAAPVRRAVHGRRGWLNDYVSVYRDLLRQAPAHWNAKSTHAGSLETIGTVETIGTMPSCRLTPRLKRRVSPVDQALPKRHSTFQRPALRSRPRCILKHGNTFAVFDSHGDIGATTGGPDGIYLDDTRFLSRLEMSLNGMQPLLLGSNYSDDDVAAYRGEL